MKFCAAISFLVGASLALGQGLSAQEVEFVPTYQRGLDECRTLVSMARLAELVALDTSDEEVCLEAAANGNPLALAYKGRIYRDGLTVLQDYEVALAAFRASAEAGDPYGIALLADALEHGIGVGSDIEEAKRLYFLASKKNEPLAQYRIGQLYQEGAAFEKDEVAANTWFRRAATQGHPAAQAELGLAYLHGTGELETDIDAALTWLGRAAAQDSDHALDELGLLYELGEQVEQDYGLAAKYYERSSALGSSFASDHLATLYLKGSGVEKDWHKTLGLLELAAEQGETFAFVRAGLILDQAFDKLAIVPSPGFARDEAKALQFLRKAFESNATDGGYLYAIAYLEGRGTDADSKKALSILEEAAQNGDATSAHHAGYLYSGNEGIPADHTKALQYLELAVTLGYEGAENDIALIVFPAVLDSNTWPMSDGAIDPDLVDRARGEALFWKAIDDRSEAAIFNLAGRYRNGDALETSVAYILYENLARTGEDFLSLGELSALLGDGRGSARDVQKQFGILRQIENADSFDGQEVYIHNLGLSYELGKGVEKDTERARELFGRAAEMGYAPSLSRLADLSDHPERKQDFLRRAAEEGYADSQDRLGTILYEEAANEAERAEAVAWFQRAFEGNDIDAPYNIALAIEEHPDDTWTNGLNANDYLVWAAQRGNAQATRRIEQILAVSHHDTAWLARHADSLHEIGSFFDAVQLYCGQIHYTCGVIQTLDLERTAFFYEQAVKGGSTQAIVDLARLLTYYPDLATGMTLGELENAMAKVRDPLAHARFNILVHGVERAMAMPIGDESARHAALYEAAIGRLGPNEVASAFFALTALSDDSDPAAATALASAFAAYGAYDAAIALVEAKGLDDLKDDWDQALTRRVLRTNELGPERPEYLAETRDVVGRFVTAFNANIDGPNADANRLNIMQRLLQADRQEELALIDETEEDGFSTGALLAALNVYYENALEAGGLSGNLISALEYRSEIHQELGDLRSATHDALTSLAVRLNILDQTRHRSGAIESNILRSCAYIGASSRMSDLGQSRLANDFAIEAFNALQRARQELLMLPSEVQSCFREDLAILYRLTADRFVSLGNFAMAERVLASLQDFEAFKFANRQTDLVRSSADAFADSGVPHKLSSEIFLEGTKLAARRALLLSRDKLTEAETAELDQLRMRIAAHARDLQSLLDSLLVVPSESDRSAASGATSVVALQQASKVLNALDEEAVVVYTYVTEDKIGFILTDKSGSDAFSIPVEKRDLLSQIARLRNTLKVAKDPAHGAWQFFTDFWKPAQDWIDARSAKRIFVYLDGPLGAVPLPALHDGAGYLVERDQVFSRIAPGAFENTSPGRTDQRGISVAAFGASKGGGGFEPLVGVPDEIDRIVIDGSDDRKGEFAGLGRLDDDFTELELERALFRASLEDRSIFHLATHFELQGSESASRILYGDGTTSTVERFRLVFGPALPAVDLIVLSACSTGVDGGQAMSSLASILRHHKVEAVMGSLWDVKDRSTSLLMARFYHYLAQSVEAPAALRHAQLDMLRGTGESDDWEPRFALPFYWAPFVFSGDLEASISAFSTPAS